MKPPLPATADDSTPEGARLRVDFIVRSDALAKGGGDNVQVEEYRRRLVAAGVDVQVRPFTPAMRARPGAIVHVLNVDRPYEFLTCCRRVRGHAIVVTPIHHAIGRVRAMRTADRGRGLASAIGRYLPEPVREWAATAVRASRATGTTPRQRLRASTTILRLLGDIPFVWRLAGHQLDRAAAVALLAAGEGEDLQALTGWTGENAILVPNGRPDHLDHASRLAWCDRAAGSILVVGRIEPRKRQVEIARAAEELDIPIVFIGQHVNASHGYARAFDAIVARSAVVSHIGVLPKDEVLRRMGRARVLLNASWVEVQSLVDLEAVTMGCAVVASSAGHSREWLGDAIHVVADDDPAHLVREARIVAEGSHAPHGSAYDWTWADAVDRLLQIYRLANKPG